MTVVDFLKRIESDSSGCCLWRGPLEPGTGYGSVKVAGIRGAHRVAWSIVNGPIPSGLCVLHRCDVRPCCNPSHLFLGTKKDNFEDMVAKGRAPLQRRPEKGEAHRRHVLTESEVRSVFELRSQGLLQREIGARFGVSRETISGILNGRGWKHLELA